jgi:hypothetical protein
MNKLPSPPAREIEMLNNLFRPETPEITMYTSQKLPNLHHWNAGYLLTAADLYRHDSFSLRGQAVTDSRIDFNIISEFRTTSRSL